MTIASGIAHLAGLNDQVISSDFVTSIKSTIQNYSIAVTEVTSHDLRNVLKKQLNDAIEVHEEISDYIMSKGYYHAYDIQEQKSEILKVSQTALNLKEAKK